MVNEAKQVMEHNSLIKWMVPLCRKIGIVQLLHLIKENVERRKNLEQREVFAKWYGQHEGDFEELFSMLEDDISRETLDNVIKYRMEWKSKYLKGYIYKNISIIKVGLWSEKLELNFSENGNAGSKIDKDGGLLYC